MRISVGQMTEIHSDSKTIGNGLQIFEGNVKLIITRVEITVKTASIKSTDLFTQITSCCAKLKKLIEWSKAVMNC